MGIHNCSPELCKVCNRPREEVVGWKLSENDQLTTDDYYGRSVIGYSKEEQ